MIDQLKAVLLGVLGAFALASQAIAVTATQQTASLGPIKVARPVTKPAPVLVFPKKTQLFVLPTTRAGWTTLLSIPTLCNSEHTQTGSAFSGVDVYVSNVSTDLAIVGVRCGSGAHSFGAQFWKLNRVTGASRKLQFTTMNVNNKTFSPKEELWGDYYVTSNSAEITLTHYNSWLAGTLGTKQVYKMKNNMVSNPVLKQVYNNPDISRPIAQWPLIWDSSWPATGVKTQPLN
jgi:hypothetical protein